eukprot:312296-Rhodomonas_salina.1
MRYELERRYVSTGQHVGSSGSSSTRSRARLLATAGSYVSRVAAASPISPDSTAAYLGTGDCLATA